MKQNIASETHWYDLWDNENGNFAYVEANISPEEMKKYEAVFLAEHLRIEEEEDVEYINRFLHYLKSKGCLYRVINRPSVSIYLDRNY